METQKRDLIQWIKTHKKELIVTGLSITALIGVVLGVKNQKVIKDLLNSLIKTAERGQTALMVKDTANAPMIACITNSTENTVSSTSKIPHDVVSHVRNLPFGWNVSAEKLATAVEHGYILMPGQTWVEAYRTGVNVA